MNLLLVGYDYMPKRVEREMNLWIDLVERLVGRGHSITIASINNAPEPLWSQRIGGVDVAIHNLRPYYVGPHGRPHDPDFTGIAYHKLPLGPLFKTLTLGMHLPALVRLIREQAIDAVHFMHIQGMFMGVLKRLERTVPVTISIPTLIDRLQPFQNVYHRMKNASWLGLDCAVLPNESTRERMRAIGVPEGKLEVIRWGVQPHTPVASADQRAARAALGLPLDARVLLSSAPMQEIGTPSDLRFSAQVHQRLRASGVPSYLVLAFKPTYKPSDSSGLDGEHVRMLETNYEQFQLYLRAADVFMSPVTDERRTVPPPLTWLEAMAAGVPVATTPVPGAAEIVVPDVNGVLAKSSEAMAAALERAFASDPRWQDMRSSACATVRARYSVDATADAYERLWSGLLRR